MNQITNLGPAKCCFYCQSYKRDIRICQRINNRTLPHMVCNEYRKPESVNLGANEPKFNGKIEFNGEVKFDEYHNDFTIHKSGEHYATDCFLCALSELLKAYFKKTIEISIEVTAKEG